MNPYLDQNFDSYTLTHHCAECETELFNPQDLIKDHVLCAWNHYGMIYFPDEIATDPETGKTLEGVIARPARTVLTKIPYSNFSFCIQCYPKWVASGIKCGVCGVDVDATQAHSRVSSLTKTSDGRNSNFTTIYIHHDCLPDKLFSKVKEYQRKYGPPN